MKALLFFLVQVFIISCSGAMQPGPVTATAITIGARNRYAGVLLAAGHGIIEFPLMVVIILGMAKIFEMPKVQIAIGIAGGIISPDEILIGSHLSIRCVIIVASTEHDFVTIAAIWICDIHPDLVNTYIIGYITGDIDIPADLLGIRIISYIGYLWRNDIWCSIPNCNII